MTNIGYIYTGIVDGRTLDVINKESRIHPVRVFINYAGRSMVDSHYDPFQVRWRVYGSGGQLIQDEDFEIIKHRTEIRAVLHSDPNSHPVLAYRVDQVIKALRGKREKRTRKRNRVTL
ncbi:MAG: hypothetical protein AABY10_06225 [Nanoarchaeota archaeon]